MQIYILIVNLVSFAVTHLFVFVSICPYQGQKERHELKTKII